MRVLILDNSQTWKMPDVSGLPNLEVWSLKHCHIESQIYNSVGMLDKLRILCASFCKYLRDFPSLNLPSLEELDLSYCVSLESFPPVVGSLGKLKILNIEGCEKLKNFPPLELPSLEKLNISSCDSLESFSHEVWLLDKLKIMHASHCPKLRSFPPLKLASLEELFLSNCESLESFPSEVGSLGKLRIFLAGGCRKLKKFPSLELPSLQELDISFCESLESFTPVVGLLDKLKILRANGCNRLWSFPLLQLASLEQLDLSYCESLGNNPEILGKMENIIHIRLHKTPMKKLPFSIRNLTRLQTLYLSNCGIVELPSSIALMSKLAELTIEEGGWLFAKQDKGEEYVSPMQTSKVEVLNLLNCNLSDEYLAIGLTWFANVKELDLSGSRFTIVPECIKECRFLWKLVLNGCERLREIREIPPSLKTFSALNCTSLTSSSRRKLLNQELHEAGNTNFLLAQSCIPKWFDHQINTQSFSLWFRNKLPAIALYFISWNNSKSAVRMIINGTSFFYRDGKNEIKRQLETHHLHIFHMQMENFNDNLDKALVENEWNHAEVRIDDDTFPVLIWGIHVLKEKTSMEDVRLNDVSFRSGGPPIEDLPFSFQSLSGLRKLYLVKCGNIQLPSSICMLRKLTKLSIEYGGWQLLKQDGDEEEGSTMRPLNVKYLCLKRCILSDESLAIGLKWFANVKELDLSGSVFSVLSECIKECRFLRKLILDDCKGLEEIREIPPCLKSLSALNCESLTSSSKSMLLNQELHEAGNTRFRLPRVWIPNWFDHQCMQGQLMSFWFQNKFPAVVIGVVSPLSWNNSKSPVRVIFNGNPFFYRDGGSENKRQPETYHLHLFHMQMEKFNSNLDKALLENKWNHVEVDFEFPFQKCGIHVLKERSSMEDIRFTDPENDINTELSL